MEELRKFLSFNKRERVAVITRMVAILGLVLFCLLYKPRAYPDEVMLHNLDSLLALRQSALDEQLDNDSVALSPFNPNTMTEQEGRRLGLAEGQIRNIINYRDKGGRFHTKGDLAKLYTISEEDYARLEPFIELPEVVAIHKSHTTESPYQNEKKAWNPPEIHVVDLNSVDSATLVSLPQIGPYTAMHIIEYRGKLGGYVSKEQLREVKGMDSTRFDVIIPYMELEEFEIRKIDVNRDDFKTLLRHPYLNYEQVKHIFSQREHRGMIRNWTQLEALLKDQGEVNPLLEYYVRY